MAESQHARLEFEPLEDRQVPSTLDLNVVEWRAITGEGNNLLLPNQGAAETRQIRFGYGAQFPDGFGDAIVTDPQRANPRTISNTIHAQDGAVFSARGLTDWAFQWGQWITHDVDLTRSGEQWNTLSTGAVGDFRIPIVDPNDPLGPNPIPFNRSQFDPATGMPDPFPGTTRLNRREVINSVTSYIDASMVYGSDPARAAELRTFEGGRLKTSADGKLLPLNATGLDNADPFGLGGRLYLAGDVRANEQVGLTAVHTLFVREHNRIVARAARLYPELTDEQLYQIARRIVGAEMQVITYEEYLPAVLGVDWAPDPAEAAYDSAVNASITNSFAHAAFRFGHSQISPATLLVNNGGHTLGSLSIRDAFFNPDFLGTDPANVSRVLLGLASQVGQENDLLLVDGVRNSLFGPPGAGGLDLAALDIQRGRDHGLPDYNTMRRLYGLEPVTSFDQISSDPAVQAKLEALFGTVGNIDLFVGGLAEDHLPGSSVGPTINAIVGTQFERLRDGDRFFYTNDAFLRSDAVRQIVDLGEVTLANVIRWNTHVTHIQDNVFFARPAAPPETPTGATRLSSAAAGDLAGFTRNEAVGDHAPRPLADVSQAAPVGSEGTLEFFNQFLAPDGGPEGGHLSVARSSEPVAGVPADNGYLLHHAFDGSARAIDINGEGIRASGVAAERIGAPAGDDARIVGFAAVIDVCDPLDEFETPS